MVTGAARAGMSRKDHIDFFQGARVVAEPVAHGSAFIPGLLVPRD
jgi:hypothetical protein